MLLADVYCRSPNAFKCAPGPHTIGLVFAFLSPIPPLMLMLAMYWSARAQAHNKTKKPVLSLLPCTLALDTPPILLHKLNPPLYFAKCNSPCCLTQPSILRSNPPLSCRTSPCPTTHPSTPTGSCPQHARHVFSSTWPHAPAGSRTHVRRLSDQLVQMLHAAADEAPEDQLRSTTRSQRKQSAGALARAAAAGAVGGSWQAAAAAAAGVLAEVVLGASAAWSPAFPVPDAHMVGQPEGRWGRGG